MFKLVTLNLDPSDKEIVSEEFKRFVPFGDFPNQYDIEHIIRRIHSVCANVVVVYAGARIITVQSLPTGSKE